MAELKTGALLKSVEAFRAEKEAVTSKEKELIDGLNAALSKIGYRVVAADAVPKRRGRPPGSTAKLRGRPAGTANNRRRRRGPGRPPGSAKESGGRQRRSSEKARTGSK